MTAEQAYHQKAAQVQPVINMHQGVAENPEAHPANRQASGDLALTLRADLFSDRAKLMMREDRRNG